MYRTPDGGISVNEADSIGISFYVSCGSCLDCRLSRSRMWATRCIHEAQSWRHSSFITLTYSDDHLPSDNSLHPDDFRNFIRRLRTAINKPFKYFGAGEYGDEGGRPHYHAIIFGHDFNRKDSTKFLNKTDAVESDELNEIWGLGHTSVGELTFDSAAYVAKYTVKKINGPMKEDHYKGLHPEFMRCSNSGIGKEYALKYREEILRNGSCMADGREVPIPTYYMKLYGKEPDDLYNELKIDREEFSSTHSLGQSYVSAKIADSRSKKGSSNVDKLKLKYLGDRYHKKDY